MQQPAYKKLSCSLKKKRNENNNITEQNTNRVAYSNTYAHHCNTLYSNIALTTYKRESADQNKANIMANKNKK